MSIFAVTTASRWTAARRVDFWYFCRIQQFSGSISSIGEWLFLHQQTNAALHFDTWYKMATEPVVQSLQTVMRQA